MIDDKPELHRLVKGVKVKHFKIDHKPIPEFSVSDFEEASKCLENNLYMKMAQDICDFEIKTYNKCILEAFERYLGCKSGEDVYNILTNPTTFFRYNAYVEYINERIKWYFEGYGLYYHVEVGQLKEPVPKSDELLETFKNAWEEYKNE